MSTFKKVAILGPGLLGGSIALAIQQRCPEMELALWGRREEVAAQGRAMGISGATSDFDEAVVGAELIILATPVGVMPHLVAMMDLSQAVLITDVGSVKRVVHQTVRPLLEGSAATFIGSHPMAGSEKAGLGAAMVDLLDGAACIITNEEQASQDQVDALKDFWVGLGCATRELSAEDHDYAVARISHFPHLLASVGATVGLAFEDIVNLAGGGMRDTTRVAAGDPALWTEILLENADALQRSLDECISELAKVQEMLRASNDEALNDYLTVAKRKRELI